MTSRFDVAEALVEIKKEGVNTTNILKFPVLLQALNSANAADAVADIKSRVDRIEDEEQRLALLSAYGFINPGLNLERRRRRIIGADGTLPQLNISESTLRKREAAAILWLEKDILGEVDSAEFDFGQLETLAASLRAVAASTEGDDTTISNELADPTLSDREFRVRTSDYIQQLTSLMKTTAQVVDKIAGVVNSTERGRLHLANMTLLSTIVNAQQGDAIVAAYSAMLKTHSRSELADMWECIEGAKDALNNAHGYFKENQSEVRGDVKKD